MTSGDRPLNPLELISSNKMNEIIKTLDKIYDIVIIDGTPSAIVSDSMAISNYINTILLVGANL
jgi:Mrp family chromosome partitioning ATPase